MRQITVWFLLFIGYVVFESVMGTSGTTILGDGDLPMMTSSIELEGKPVRPRLFQSPEQIRMYLDNLGKWYTFHNRNRFGKRMGSGPSVASSFGEPFESNRFQEYEVRNTL